MIHRYVESTCQQTRHLAKLHMRIMIIVHELPPLGGGAGRASWQIALELVKLGHSVEIVTTSYNKPYQKEQYDNLTVYRVFGARRSNLDNILWVTMPSFAILGSLVAIWRYKRTRPDKVLCFITVPGGMVGCALKFIYSARICVAIRGSDVPGHVSGKSRIVEKFHKLLCRKIWTYADTITALSEGLKRQALRTSPDTNIHVIYNGVDTKRFRRTNVSRQERRFSIITVSRLVEHKGIQHLIKAIRYLLDRDLIKDINVSIIGSGDYCSKIQRQIRVLQLDGHIHMMGEIAQHELPQHYSNADIFVLPSLSEAFGNVFCEAMACGLPVIGTTVGGIPEVVEHERNGFLVEPGNVTELAESILRLANSQELRSQISEYNQTYVKRKFAWNMVAKQYLAL